MIHRWLTKRTLQAYQDGSLSKARCAEVRRHLEKCSACSEELAAARRLDHLLATSLHDPRPLSAQAQDRLFQEALFEAQRMSSAPPDVFRIRRALVPASLLAGACLLLICFHRAGPGSTGRGRLAKAKPDVPRITSRFASHSSKRPGHESALGPRIRSSWPATRPLMAEGSRTHTSQQSTLTVVPALAVVHSSLQCIQNEAPDTTEDSSDPSATSAAAPVLTVRVEKVSDTGVLVPLVDIHVEHLPEGMPGYAQASTRGESETGQLISRVCSLTKTDDTTRLQTAETMEEHREGIASILRVASICTAANATSINPNPSQEDLR